MLSDKPENRLRRARVSLEGLSVGDGFGGFYEMSSSQPENTQRKLPPAPWHYTDDTNMALSVYEILRRYGTIQQDELAKSFAEHFDRLRGYGMGAWTLLNRIRYGEHWREVSGKLFGGGSYGNGGAMRVAPLGAYFADDLSAAAEQAALSAEITHAHPEGIAGAIGVAIGAAYACRLKDNTKPSRQEFLNQLLPHIPAGELKTGIDRAAALPADVPLREVVEVLGNGSRVTAPDTVPFALWCAGEYLDNYELAIWQTLNAGGDVDTTAAIVGGIVVCYTGIEGIPAEWVARREPLPGWAFGD